MPSPKQVVDSAVSKGLAQGQWGPYDDRLDELESAVVRALESNGYSPQDGENAIGHTIREYCDSHLTDVWPHDAGDSH